MLNRRQLLKWAGFTGVGASAWSFLRRDGFLHSLGEARSTMRVDFDPDVELLLTAAPATAKILPGAPTKVWQFTGTVVKGPSTALQVIPDSFLGPIIRLQRGQKVRIRFVNRLDEPSIVHWHGLDVPESADGHPHLAVAPGGEYIYEFEVINPAGSYWYHPHPHGATGKQVFQGLAGLLVVSTPEEAALGLPAGDADLPCVLQDRAFDNNNQLSYLAGGMMDQMHGSLAQQMLVNGKPKAELSLATKAYRLRVLNASSARVYKLVWDDGTPMTVIGMDGGLLSAPVEQKFLTLAPSQRADVILDLSKHAVGSKVQLRSAPFTASEVSIDEGGMMGGMMGGMAQNGTSLLLMTVQVARKESVPFQLPRRLIAASSPVSPTGTGKVRQIALDFKAGQWLIAGKTFDMMAADPEETVVAGSDQVWEVSNVGGMMGQQMAHPFHVHGRPFRILSRTPLPGAVTPVNSVREGLVDGGWRDTVLVMPNEMVRLQMHFTDFPGLYLYHCHILEHEDTGMMRNFRVTA